MYCKIGLSCVYYNNEIHLRLDTPPRVLRSTATPRTTAQAKYALKLYRCVPHPGLFLDVSECTILHKLHKLRTSNFTYIWRQHVCGSGSEYE